MSASISPLQQRLNSLILPLIKPQKLNQQRQTSEQGVTLLECLVAIAVIGLTVALITPPLLIATATRVQNRRAEQAVQLAQGEVDRIRVMVARGTHTVGQLPKDVSVTGNNLQNFNAPSGVIAFLKSPNRNCNTFTGQQLDPTKVLPVDIDADCKPDLLMQVFRTTGNITTAEKLTPDPTKWRPSDFQVGIRVYSILASTNPNSATVTLQQNLKKDPAASLGLTQGQGEQRSRPLAVIYTPFSWSERSNTLCAYRNSDTAQTKQQMNCNVF